MLRQEASTQNIDSSLLILVMAVMWVDDYLKNSHHETNTSLNISQTNMTKLSVPRLKY